MAAVDPAVHLSSVPPVPAKGALYNAANQAPPGARFSEAVVAAERALLPFSVPAAGAVAVKANRFNAVSPAKARVRPSVAAPVGKAVAAKGAAALRAGNISTGTKLPSVFPGPGAWYGREAEIRYQQDPQSESDWGLFCELAEVRVATSWVS